MPHSDKSKDVALRKAPSNALYRSQIEIRRILHLLAREEVPIFAEVGDEKLFVTKILLVDDQSGNLVLEYGAEKSINSALFDHTSVKYRASYRGAHLVFKASKPAEIVLSGKPAITFAIPGSLLWSQRREQSRVIIPPHVPLDCIYKDDKGDFFKTRIFDISLDGMGGMVCDESSPLRAGMVLKGCRITYLGGEPITVDLVVRHIKTITRADGTIFTRAGVRFIQRPEEIRTLINFFVHDLDGSASWHKRR